MNILRDSIAALSPVEQESEQKVLTEFANLTNSQVHKHIFANRMMLPKKQNTTIHFPSDILGTDSCELILPSLHKTIQTVLSNTSDSSEFHLLDIGAGSGEIIDWCFSKELEKSNRQNIIHIVEQNTNLLQSYQQKLCGYSHLSQGIVYNGRIHDYFDMNYDGKNVDNNKLRMEIPLPLIPLDFINCLHMINYLVDINSPNEDPSDDIISFCKFNYSLLKPGGAMYIAHLDVSGLFNSDEIDDDHKDSEEISQKIKNIILAKNSLLYEGDVIDHLHSSELNECEVRDYDSDDNTTRGSYKRKIKTIPKFNSYKLPSSLYAKSLADISVLLLISQLSKIKNNEKKFDIKLLENILSQVKEAALTPGENKRFGLKKGMRGNEIVWKVDLTLIISIIRKEKV